MVKNITLIITDFVVMFVSLFLCSSCVDNNNYKKKELEKYELLSKQNTIVCYEDFNKLLNKTAKGTHYVYFGKAECPWCQEYLPIYSDFFKNNNIELLYYNAEYVKGTYETKTIEGKIELHVNEEYMQIVNYIKQFDEDYSKEYVKLNLNLKDSEGNSHISPWLYVPRLFKIVDGEIIDCIKPLKEHKLAIKENGEYYLPSLSNVQKDTLNEELEAFCIYQKIS